MNNALCSPNDGWQLLGYKRPEHGYSFSQVLFRAIRLPESISDGASNITMHQLLRILYVDQLTPVQRLFRVENLDTWQTRQAVDDLLTCVVDRQGVGSGKWGQGWDTLGGGGN